MVQRFVEVAPTSGDQPFASTSIHDTVDDLAAELTRRRKD
jgi:hypothetical protein